MDHKGPKTFYRHQSWLQGLGIGTRDQSTDQWHPKVLSLANPGSVRVYLWCLCVYSCLFVSILSCLFVSIRVYSCLFVRVYSCLFVSIPVYSCLFVSIIGPCL